MARAHPFQDKSNTVSDPQPGEWQALRGELVALLDQVEGRYAQAPQEEPAEPALAGLTERVRNLRDQVVGPEPTVRRQEALRTVKRAVDRFSEREDATVHAQQDMLSSAIAEIRGSRAPVAAPVQSIAAMPDFRELNGLVGGLSGRIERLEGELKSQRTGSNGVREVASQVEQLTHVVELLAGAVGETGQVKRLESQIGALAALIEDGPKVDLSTINKRLDDVSVTVAKLAELQAQQMEREIVREDARASKPAPEGAAALAPAMHAIEKSVRNVYDRIDSIEKNVTLSSSDFERLTSEMADFTQAMKEREAVPTKLFSRVDALAAHIGDLQTANGDVAGLKSDIASLRDAVLAGMEPRFHKIESRLEELTERVSMPVDSSQVENQLRLLMARMDDTSAQLDNMARLYATPSDIVELEALATIVAERTTDAITRKAPAPVAMFGPDSLKSIEDRIQGLIKTAGKGPDYETIASMVAEKTSAAVAKSAPAATVSDASIDAFEQRVTALFNTAGQDTAERLTRLEAAIAARAERQPEPAKVPPASATLQPAKVTIAPSTKPELSADSRSEKLDAMLAALGASPTLPDRDAMPANPADEAPLIDQGFKDKPANWAPLDARFTAPTQPVLRQPAPELTPTEPPRPMFDAASVERPARPQSSFATEADPFASIAAPATTPVVQAPVSQSNTSTFVAAARRAQRARQEIPAPVDATTGSAMGRALARFMPAKPADGEAPAVVAPLVETPVKPAKIEKAPKPVKEKKVKAVAPEPIAPRFGEETDEALAQPGFLVKYRRPLLLAAVLATVSILALNLILQRSAEQQPETTPAAAITEAPAPTPDAQPAADQDVSLVRPDARVIDMIDNTTTASINPTIPSAFSRTADVTPMPGALLANAAAQSKTPGAEPALTGTPDMQTTASITPSDVPETFDLPAEGVGPIELRQAAADGDARAQFEIAAIYTEGRAIEQDYTEAAKWYERSAAQGLVPAQYRLGNLYETGTGVEKDLEVAKLWYQRAAESGNRMAMHNLAALYASGQLGDQEFDTAAEWFQQAADRGMTDSQFNLGMLYARGLGVEQNFEQSFKWFSLAAKNGDADAAKARDDIAKSLNADAVSRVGTEIATWKAEPIELSANFAPLGTWSATFDPGQAITTRDVVSKVQTALAKLGFDVGTPDGMAGPKTSEAIKAFERDTGMTEVGAINPRLLAVLGSQPV